MSEEIKTQNEQKNTVASVGMWFSISGITAIILIILGVVCLINGFILGIFLLLIGNILGLLTFGYLNLLVGFILGIVGLFYKPKTKARIAIIIPLVIAIALASIACYLRNLVKTPANEFFNWAEPQFEQLQDEKDFDEDRFGDILEAEVNKTIKSTTEDEWKVMFDASTGSNFLEKGSYLFFSIVRQSMETALEKYNNGEIVEIDGEDNHIIDVDVDVNDDEIDQDSDDDEDNDESNGDNDEQVKPVEQEEVTVVQTKSSNNGTFSQSERNDIEQVLDILE